MNEREEVKIDNSNYSHFIGVSFANNKRAYYFGYKDMDLNLGDKVVVETVRGLELGTISFPSQEISKYKSELGLKPILRKATDTDIRLNERNLQDAETALAICKEEVVNHNLDMNLLSCEYTLDKAKVIFTYVADERVDFRELLKTLASKLHTRIELRQIGSRDKAKLVGGIGMCGLPLCCSTFLNEFDGISITRAKNQMLSINIPKLSGHCGKLLCCLKYEDDAYTELKEKFPPLGAKVFIDKVQYTVSSINVISNIVRVDSEENTMFLDLQDFFAQTKYRIHKEKHEEN